MVKQYPIFLDSSAPSSTVSGDGKNILTTNLQAGIIINKLERASYVATASTFYYVMPNVSVKLGNNTWTWTDPSSVTHTYVFPDGLYGIDDIQNQLSSFLLDDGFPANTFIISGIDSTQHTSIQINSAVGTILNFSTNTIAGINLMGFTPAQNITTTQSPDIIISELKATFNKISNVIFNLNICNGAQYNGFAGTQAVMSAN